MPFATKVTVAGPSISPNVALQRSQADDIDDAAAAFGDRLLVRIDPRDIRLTADNPTGAKRIHYTAPNRDPALFTGSGLTVGPISGKYDGKDVFRLTRTGTAALGTNSDLNVGPKSLDDITDFSLFGVAHYDSAMLGQTGLHILFGLLRDNSAFESVIAHQYSGGVNYLSIYADQGEGSGANHVLDGSTTILAGVPFAYMFRVKSSGQRSGLFINQLTTVLMSQNNSALIDAGSMKAMIGHGTADDAQWAGGHGRAYIISGDALDTAENQALSAELMTQLKTYYGIA